MPSSALNLPSIFYETDPSACFLNFCYPHFLPPARLWFVLAIEYCISFGLIYIVWEIYFTTWY